MLGSGLNSGVDPTQVDQEVQSALRRPVLTIVCIVAFFAFGVWYFTGGSANGSSHQAEQLILTNTNPYGGNFTNGANVQTVNCTQESQSLAARLRGFISPGDNHGSSQSPLTYYNCSGTSTSGAPMQWCVIYPPRDNHYNLKPEVDELQPGNTCPA